MRIACLAWGSLIWKTQPLVLASGWQADGPSLPIEFCRVGDTGELATALWAAAAPVPTRWALLATPNLAEAREQLRQREAIDPARPDFVGDTASAAGHTLPGQRIAGWAQRLQLDAVVWTALPPRFAEQNGRAPDLEQAVAYLQSLRGAVLAHAEHYVRHVPAEIRTPYRAAFESRLGWTATAAADAG